MRCEAEASRCLIEEVGVETREFVREQGVSEGVSFSGSSRIPGQESKG